MLVFLADTIFIAALFLAGAESEGTQEFALRAQSSETVSFSDKEIKEVLAGPKDMIRLNRLGGLLNDLLREQKKAFVIARGHVKNEVAMKVEDLMNNANLSASQAKYEEGFKSLEKAYRLMIDSMKQLTTGK